MLVAQRSFIGLARTIIIRSIHGLFGRESPNIRSYTAYIYSSDQPCSFTCPRPAPLFLSVFLRKKCNGTHLFPAAALVHIQPGSAACCKLHSHITAFLLDVSFQRVVSQHCLAALSTYSSCFKCCLCLQERENLLFSLLLSSSYFRPLCPSYVRLLYPNYFCQFCLNQHTLLSLSRSNQTSLPLSLTSV